MAFQASYLGAVTVRIFYNALILDFRVLIFFRFFKIGSHRLQENNFRSIALSKALGQKR